MGWSGFWFFCRVPPELEARVAEHLEPALARVRAEVMPPDDMQQWLSCASCPFDGLGLGGFEEILDVDLDLIDMLSCNHASPAGVLLYALGAERAKLLPGTLGNFFVPAPSVAKCAEQVRAIIGQSPEATRSRGLEALREDGIERDLDRIFTALPAALDDAAAKNKGFLAFGSGA